MGRTVLLQVENIDYDALQKHFNMPMADAAKKFGVSLTLFKSICRKNGIQRWPHRKLRSLQNKIADLQTRLEDHPNAAEHQLRRRLDELQGASGSNLAVDPSAGCGSRPIKCPRLPQDADGMPGSSEQPPTNTTATAPAKGAGPNFTYEELRKHFYLPLTEAAKHSGVSSTVFKKICRKNGIRKWPHRKLKSLQSKILDLQSRIASNQGAQETELKRRLDELKCLDTTNDTNQVVGQLFSLNQFIAPPPAAVAAPEAAQPQMYMSEANLLDAELLESDLLDAELLESDLMLGMTDAELDQGIAALAKSSPSLQPMSRVQSVEMLCEMINGGEQNLSGMGPRILSTDALCDMDKYAPPMSRVQSAEALCDMQEAGMITCWVGPEGWNEGGMNTGSPIKQEPMYGTGADAAWRNYSVSDSPSHFMSNLAPLDDHWRVH